MAWLPDGENFLKICLFILTEFMKVQADRHTHIDTASRHNIGHACTASSDKNRFIHFQNIVCTSLLTDEQMDRRSG